MPAGMRCTHNNCIQERVDGRCNTYVTFPARKHVRKSAAGPASHRNSRADPRPLFGRREGKVFHTGARPNMRRLLQKPVHQTKWRRLLQGLCNANKVATAKPTTPTCIVLPSNAHNVRAGNSL